MKTLYDLYKYLKDIKTENRYDNFTVYTYKFDLRKKSMVNLFVCGEYADVKSVELTLTATKADNITKLFQQLKSTKDLEWSLEYVVDLIEEIEPETARKHKIEALLA